MNIKEAVERLELLVKAAEKGNFNVIASLTLQEAKTILTELKKQENGCIKAEWRLKDELPKEEHEYTVTVSEPLMFDSRGGSSFATTTSTAYYDPKNGWDRTIIAWTDAYIEPYLGHIK